MQKFQIWLHFVIRSRSNVLRLKILDLDSYGIGPPPPSRYFLPPKFHRNMENRCCYKFILTNSGTYQLWSYSAIAVMQVQILLRPLLIKAENILRAVCFLINSELLLTIEWLALLFINNRRWHFALCTTVTIVETIFLLQVNNSSTVAFSERNSKFTGSKCFSNKYADLEWQWNPWLFW